MFENMHSSTAASRMTPPVRKISGLNVKVARDPIKRSFDFCAALLLIIFLLPGLVLIASLIKIDSPGHVFFRQRRTGMDGKAFYIIKFRSMTVAEDGHNVVQAEIGDKRVTRVGKVLRKTSLDELPQIFNILKGDMSFVGPRPHALAHDAEFSLSCADYDRRFAARPGLTGLAQVRGYRGEVRTIDDLNNRVSSDLEYIATYSFIGDITLILRTIPCLFGHHNAY